MQALHSEVEQINQLKPHLNPLPFDKLRTGSKKRGEDLTECEYKTWHKLKILC
jgi:hypothetical protein